MKMILLLIVVGMIAISKCQTEDNLCDLSRNQKLVLVNCLQSFLSEEQKAAEQQFYQCLGYDSEIDYYEGTCGFSKEEQEQYEQILEKCFNEMPPYEFSATDEDIKNCVEKAKESKQ
uniref:Venom toxin meuEnz24 n=1 Tax=Mesobuthus eupeus TaxID=34648 RepID=A0A146CIZ3_MESEU|nr:venom toxin meuEnz24 [Mesobuthus eupeus]